MKAWLSMEAVKVVRKVRIQDFPKNKLVRRHGDSLGNVEEFRISLMFQVWAMGRRVVPLIEKKNDSRNNLEAEKHSVSWVLNLNNHRVNRRHEERNRYVDLEVTTISSTVIECILSSRHCTCT